jgi:hypothetical protein
MSGDVAVSVGVDVGVAAADQSTWRPLRTNANVWRPKSHKTRPSDSSHLTPSTMSKEPSASP